MGNNPINANDPSGLMGNGANGAYKSSPVKAGSGKPAVDYISFGISGVPIVGFELILSGSGKVYGGVYGLTLDDVDDHGEIIPVLEGVLPASLPYQLNSSNVRRYNTLAEHDAAQPTRPWRRILKITLYPCHPDSYTGTPSTSTYEVSMANVVTDRLEISNSTAINGTSDYGHHGLSM